MTVAPGGSESVAVEESNVAGVAVDVDPFHRVAVVVERRAGGGPGPRGEAVGRRFRAGHQRLAAIVTSPRPLSRTGWRRGPRRPPPRPSSRSPRRRGAALHRGRASPQRARRSACASTSTTSRSPLQDAFSVGDRNRRQRTFDGIGPRPTRAMSAESPAGRRRLRTRAPVSPSLRARRSRTPRPTAGGGDLDHRQRRLHRLGLEDRHADHPGVGRRGSAHSVTFRALASGLPGRPAQSPVRSAH